MKDKIESPIVLLGARLLSPYIMVFGWYVIFHGHYSPGGGFQGGALLAASILLIRVAGGRKIGALQLQEKINTPLAVIGVLIYFATGLAAIFTGGYFLDYGYLPIPGMDPSWLRYTGILIIEVGIGLAVMAILVMIYDNMAQGEDRD
ncbi:MAG: MnhB domain-containing protein [Balneolaceae bacterium]